MALLTVTYLKNRAEKASPYISESYVRSFSAQVLASNAAATKSSDSFDIFLSHSFEDAILIKALRDELVDHGYSVYVDWIDDQQLDRSRVSKASAATLRLRMSQSKSLLFATSDSAKKSIWMPWELGYMDAQHYSRVAVAPIVADIDAERSLRDKNILDCTHTSIKPARRYISTLPPLLG